MAKKKRQGPQEIETKSNDPEVNETSESVQALALKAAASWAFLLEPAEPAPQESAAPESSKKKKFSKSSSADGSQEKSAADRFFAQISGMKESADELEQVEDSNENQESADGDDILEVRSIQGTEVEVQSADTQTSADAQIDDLALSANEVSEYEMNFVEDENLTAASPVESTTELEFSAELESENEAGFLASAEFDVAEETEETEESEMLVDLASEREEDAEGFLASLDQEELSTAEADSKGNSEAVEALKGSELEGFETADIEDLEFVEEERLDSIIESILFASDRPVSLHQIKLVFKGTQIKTDQIRRALEKISVELASARRGITLEEAPGGYQLRTKVDNMHFLTRTLKARPFKVSGPALEVLAIVAYKQPLIKSEVDDIRGVESGHLLRALMEKGLINFEGKSDLPGKPMQYGTTRKFLEIFGLRNLRELPTLSQIDELLPEGIDEVEAEKPTLSQITDSMSEQYMGNYSEGEDELTKITEQLQVIETSTDFFEQEKLRERQRRDNDRAQSLREALLVGETISTRDRNWLIRYDEALSVGQTEQFAQQELVKAGEIKAQPTEAQALAFDQDTDTGQASTDEEPSLFESEVPADDEELAVPYHDEEDEEV